MVVFRPVLPPAKPTPFEHGDPGNFVFLSHVISRREAVATSTDDDCIVFGLRCGTAPLSLPILVMAQGVPSEAVYGKTRVHRGIIFSDPMFLYFTTMRLGKCLNRRSSY